MAFPNTSMLTSWGPGQGIDRDIEFFDDFTSYDGVGPVGTTKWLHTAVNTALFVCSPGGLKITNAGADNDGLNMQGNCGAAGGRFTPAVGRDIYCAMRLKVSDADSIDWVAGLGSVDTTTVAGTADFIGFGPTNGTTPVNSASANLHAIHGDDIGGSWAAADMTDTGFDLVDDQYVDLAFWCQGIDRTRYYVNGKETTVVTLQPDAGTLLTPTMAFIDRGGNATIIDIEYYYCVQKRIVGR